MRLSRARARGPPLSFLLQETVSARKLDSRQQVSDGEKNDLRYQCEHLSDLSFVQYTYTRARATHMTPGEHVRVRQDERIYIYIEGER